MDFEKPDAYQALVNKSVGAGTRGEAWDKIGDPMSEGVDRTIPAYDAKLELNLAPKTPEKRQEVNELRWGKIKKDAVRLEGLAAAMENISQVVKSGKDKLAHDWKGESFEAFKTAVDRVEKTLNDYAAACKTTAGGLTSAMESAEQLYSTYSTNCVRIFDFSAYPKPDDWKKVTQEDLDEFAETCGDWHEWTLNCDKDDDDAKAMIGKLATPDMLKWFDSNECDESGDKVRGMASEVVSKSEQTRQSIREKIHGFYTATDDLKEQVTELQDAALENMRIMAELKVFGLMKVPTAPKGGGGQNPPGGGGDDKPGGGGGTPPGGGGGTPPGGGGGGQTPTPPTPPPPDLSSLEKDGKPDPNNPLDPDNRDQQKDGKPDPNNPLDPDNPGNQPGGPDGSGGTGGKPETVKIEEDGRTIEVTSPDSQGQVKVTVDDGTGQPKTYTLDFGAGGTPLPGGVVPAGPGFGPEGSGGAGGPGGAGGSQAIMPGEDGKAVISDPPMTITAERPGGGDVVVVTVDDGKGGEPTTYTLDYSDPEPSAKPGKPEDVAPMPAPATGQPLPSGFTSDSPWTDPSAASYSPAEPASVGGGGVASHESAPSAAMSGGPTSDPGLTTPSSEGASGAAGTAFADQVATPNEAMAAAAAVTGESALSGAVNGNPGGSDGQPGGSAGMGAMGGGMMGGGAQGQGGDGERSGGQWRTSGNLFDDDFAEADSRIGGFLGDFR